MIGMRWEPRRWARRSAAAGVAGWAFAVVGRVEDRGVVICFAALVLAPLVLARVSSCRAGWSGVVVLQMIGAAGVVVSYRLAPGRATGAWTTVWLAAALGALVMGVSDWRRRGWRSTGADLRLLALGWWPVAATWLLATRSGWSLAGFKRAHRHHGALPRRRERGRHGDGSHRVVAPTACSPRGGG